MSVELRPIRTKKIYEEIVEQIKDLITDGQLKPGDKLPSERTLVESFRVSRASIREALSALEMMGMVEVRTGEGTFIKQIKSDSIVTPLVWALGIDKGSVIELLEVRNMLEVQMVGFAAERATLDEIRDLDRILNIGSSLLTKEIMSESADINFHYKIALASHNNIVIRLMDTITDNVHHMMRVSRSKLYEDQRTVEILYSEHVKIFEAIKSKDVIKAQKWMLRHLQTVEKELFN